MYPQAVPLVQVISDCLPGKKIIISVVLALLILDSKGDTSVSNKGLNPSPGSATPGVHGW